MNMSFDSSITTIPLSIGHCSRDERNVVPSQMLVMHAIRLQRLAIGYQRHGLLIDHFLPRYVDYVVGRRKASCASSGVDLRSGASFLVVSASY